MLLIFMLFGVLFIGIAVFVSRRSEITDVDDFVVAGRRLPFGVVSASVMVSWLWTTSLLGAAEAGYLFGVGGGFAFALGSAVPFFIFIPLVLRLRRIMPHGTTYLEFIEQRYGRGLQYIFLGLTILLALYISTEQIIGISYAVSGSYDISYSVVAIGVTAVVVLYIAIAGLRGAVINDVIQFFVISVVALVLLPVLLTRFGVGNLYDGLARVAQGSGGGLQRPDALNVLAPAAIRYFVVALVVSMGFVLLNQGYYSKARATASNKSLLSAYIVGTVVAWAPIPILFGIVLGGIGLAEGVTPGAELGVTTDVASYVFSDIFSGFGVVLFTLVIFMAGLTTAGNALAGFQALVAVDFQQRILGRADSGSAQRKRFIRVATVGFGVVVAAGAVALEGVSLLHVDIVSGIIFATPAGALLAGLYWRRPTGRAAGLSILFGLAGGVTTYLAIDDPDLNYFVANVVSLLLPAVVVAVGSLFSKRRYDFAELAGYRAVNPEEASAEREAGRRAQ